MIYSELPLYPDSKYYTYSCALESKQFNFTFLWNDRDSSWRMTIKEEDLTEIVRAHRLVSSYPMMADYSLESYGITGYFLLLPKTVDLEILNEQPGNLAQYYKLFYVYEG